ncbi:MAG: hypothetical protein ACK5MU_01190 [Candidatus Saccharimonadales bacterium]
MRINKNVKKIATLSVVGALAVGAIFAISREKPEDVAAIAGSWADFVDVSWTSASDARYSSYSDAPGSTLNSPYLIKTAEEFSGLRTFEDTEALAGKYIMLVNDIDLSAHYWDPIKLYGEGNIWDDAFANGDIYTSELPESEVVHLDGNSRVVKGMNIQNSYTEALMMTNTGGVYTAGATGLFGHLFKAEVSDLRIESPIMNLTRDSEISIYGDEYGMDNVELEVIDAISAAVGVAQRSTITGVHVTDLNFSYTAGFGEYFTGVDGADHFYSPMGIHAGGAIGAAFNRTIVGESSVKGGAVSVKPVVDEVNVGTMYSLDNYGSAISVAGLVGYSLESTIMSTCSSADVIFSDDGFTLNRSVDGNRPLFGYGMYFGGLVGFSSTRIPIYACIYNSCSHSDLNIDAEISEMTGVGGIAGGVYEDRLINNFYDGEIDYTNSGGYLGEIVGYLENGSTDSIVANYYADNGSNYPVGTFYAGDESEAFKIIGEAEMLAEDMNNGRALVLADITDHTNLDASYITQFLVEWSVQDGSFTLSCLGGIGVGPECPDKRVVEVPNTGFDK